MRKRGEDHWRAESETRQGPQVIGSAAQGNKKRG